MSNLITTAQDTLREQCIDAYVGLQNMPGSLRDKAGSLARRVRESDGQTAAEYMGILLIVATIIAAIFMTPLGHDIASRISTLVSDIGNGTDPSGGGGGGGGGAKPTGN